MGDSLRGQIGGDQVLWVTGFTRVWSQDKGVEPTRRTVVVQVGQVGVDVVQLWVLLRILGDFEEWLEEVPQNVLERVYLVGLLVDVVQSWNLNQPSDIVTDQVVVNDPRSKLVPFINRTTIDGDTVLTHLILGVLQVTEDFLGDPSKERGRSPSRPGSLGSGLEVAMRLIDPSLYPGLDVGGLDSEVLEPVSPKPGDFGMEGGGGGWKRLPTDDLREFRFTDSSSPSIAFSLASWSYMFFSSAYVKFVLRDWLTLPKSSKSPGESTSFDFLRVTSGSSSERSEKFLAGSIETGNYIVWLNAVTQSMELNFKTTCKL
ncbi:hypothetical protein WICPIJ_005736 [Wickerhamomyces pijperi]|uniref:Uncharacterized protein n=1 Tax=Wickerhamomyces pijperi TaxID=599730 RepID=A0A9P8Q2Z1_WICPI|nr:hypothetical protein WICPIJ_005736 [Wickerhamomyces pijperi]